MITDRGGVVTQPPETGRKTTAPWRRFSPTLWLVLVWQAFLVAAGIAVGSSRLISRAAPGGDVPTSPTRSMRSVDVNVLSPSTPVIDQGVVPQGACGVEFFSVTNRSATAISVARIKSSCECAEVKLSRSTIGPGETVTGLATLDLAQSPDFVGGLAAEIAAHRSSGAELFRVEVRAEVIPRDDFTGITRGAIHDAAFKPWRTP
jgi:hypothetical protein